ncbi:SpoIID/LytB domain-containing protein [Bdellovibrionota bacterium FG-1]
MKLLLLSCSFTEVFGLICSSVALAALSPVGPTRPLTGVTQYPAEIRVRLAEAMPSVRIRGFDLKIYEVQPRNAPLASRRLASAPDRQSDWEFRCQKGNVRGTSKAKMLDFRDGVSIESASGFVHFQGRPYRQEIQIHAIGSSCEVVNHVEIEKYLDGLVNSEFSARWNEESVGAQVIAARTYALHQALVARADLERHFDVDASTRDQVYDGSIKEDFRSSRSVRRTRGLVLTVGSASHPEPLKAFYHSTCGGVTELPEHVWGRGFKGFRHSVRCGYCNSSPAFNWKAEIAGWELAQAFQKGLFGEGRSPASARVWPKGWRQAIRGGHLIALRADGKDLQGRVDQVTSVWQTPQGPLSLPLRGASLRDWIGPTRLKSATFQVVSQGAGDFGRWTFQGRGNGHGVGMCQWGAKTMGEQGFKTATILKHYYPDAVLRKLW